MGDTVKRTVSRDGLVQNSEFANDLRIRIGEQRNMNAAALREIVKYFGGVVADRCNPQTQFLKFTLVLFQLTELGFAIWSPIGRAENQDHSAFRSEQALESAHLAILVVQIEARHSRPNWRPKLARAEGDENDEE